MTPVAESEVMFNLVIYFFIKLVIPLISQFLYHCG